MYNINSITINNISGYTNGCVCLGDTLKYNCTDLGSIGGATVWRGTALSGCEPNCSMCTFAIEAVVCGNLSDSVNVTIILKEGDQAKIQGESTPTCESKRVIHVVRLFIYCVDSSACMVKVACGQLHNGRRRPRHHVHKNSYDYHHI